MNPKLCLSAISYFALHCYGAMFFHLPCKLHHKFYQQHSEEIKTRVRRGFSQSRCNNQEKGIFVAMLRDNKLVYSNAGITELAWTCIPLMDLHYYGDIDKMANKNRGKDVILRCMLCCMFSNKNSPVRNVEAALNMLYKHCGNRLSWDDLLTFWRIAVRNGNFHLACLFPYVRMDQATLDLLAIETISIIRSKVHEIRKGKKEYNISGWSHTFDIRSLFYLQHYKFTGELLEGMIPQDGNYLYKELIPIMANYPLLGISRDDAQEFLRIGVNIPGFISCIIEETDVTIQALLIRDLVLMGFLDITSDIIFEIGHHHIGEADGRTTTIGGIVAKHGFAELFPLLLDVEKFKKSPKHIELLLNIYLSLTTHVYFGDGNDTENETESFDYVCEAFSSGKEISSIPTPPQEDILYRDKLALFMRHQLYDSDSCNQLLSEIDDDQFTYVPEDRDLETWMIKLLQERIRSFGQQPPSSKRAKTNNE
jgi:hypothetical protein